MYELPIRLRVVWMDFQGHAYTSKWDDIAGASLETERAGVKKQSSSCL